MNLKRQMVFALLDTGGDWPTASDRSIARQCSISQTTAGKYRTEWVSSKGGGYERPNRGGRKPGWKTESEDAPEIKPIRTVKEKPDKHIDRFVLRIRAIANNSTGKLPSQICTELVNALDELDAA